MDLNEASLVEGRSEEVADAGLYAENGLRSRSSKINDTISQSGAIPNDTLSGSFEFLSLVMHAQLGFLD